MNTDLYHLFLAGATVIGIYLAVQLLWSITQLFPKLKIVYCPKCHEKGITTRCKWNDGYGRHDCPRCFWHNKQVDRRKV